MAWKGVITNSGSELLAQWTAGKTLTITETVYSSRGEKKNKKFLIKKIKIKFI